MRQFSDRIRESVYTTLVSDLFLQILAKRIIVSPNGDVIDHELHSPFSYLTRLVADLCEEPHKCGSGLVRLGVFENGEPPTIPVERFLATLRLGREMDWRNCPSNWRTADGDDAST